MHDRARCNCSREKRALFEWLDNVVRREESGVGRRPVSVSLKSITKSLSRPLLSKSHQKRWYPFSGLLSSYLRWLSTLSRRLKVRSRKLRDYLIYFLFFTRMRRVLISLASRYERRNTRSRSGCNCVRGRSRRGLLAQTGNIRWQISADKIIRTVQLSRKRLRSERDGEREGLSMMNGRGCEIKFKIIWLVNPILFKRVYA